MDGEGTLGDPCLDAGIFDTATVQFRIDDGELEVFHWSEEERAWRACEEAIEIGGDSFLLHYHCNVHPRFQNSAIVVVPM